MAAIAMPAPTSLAWIQLRAISGPESVTGLSSLARPITRLPTGLSNTPDY